MAKINHIDLGEVVNTMYLEGIVTKVYPNDDTCDLTIDGVTYSKVAIFYHCSPTAELRSNGALYGAAEAFAVGSIVIVQTRILKADIKVPTVVIGFKAGLTECGCVGASGLVLVEGASWRNIDMSFGGADMYSYIRYDHGNRQGEQDPYYEAGLMERAADDLMELATVLPVSCHPLLSFTSGLDFVQMDIAPGILVSLDPNWKYVFMHIAYRIAPTTPGKAYLITGILSHEYNLTFYNTPGLSLTITQIDARPEGGDLLFHEYGKRIGTSENASCGSFVRTGLSFCMLSYLSSIPNMNPPLARLADLFFFFDHEYYFPGFIRCDAPSFMRFSNLKVIEVSTDFSNINPLMFESAAGIPWEVRKRNYYCDK